MREIEYRDALNEAFDEELARDENVVIMGEKLKARIAELASDIPLGMEFGIVSLQSEAVVTAIDGFTVSLAQAVAIVIV